MATIQLSSPKASFGDARRSHFAGIQERAGSASFTFLGSRHVCPLDFSSSSHRESLLRTSNKCSVLVSRWLWTFFNKMIWISASKALPFTFAVFVVSASLKGLFVVPRLSHESTSSLKELLEVSPPWRTLRLHYRKSNTLRH
ncbi:hypothetical protein Tco_1494009 [Tanacetum coccineum]